MIRKCVVYCEGNDYDFINFLGQTSQYHNAITHLHIIVYLSNINMISPVPNNSTEYGN